MHDDRRLRCRDRGGSRSLALPRPQGRRVDRRADRRAAGGLHRSLGAGHQAPLGVQGGAPHHRRHLDAGRHAVRHGVGARASHLGRPHVPAHSRPRHRRRRRGQPPPHQHRLHPARSQRRAAARPAARAGARGCGRLDGLHPLLDDGLPGIEHQGARGRDRARDRDGDGTRRSISRCLRRCDPTAAGPSDWSRG